MLRNSTRDFTITKINALRTYVIKYSRFFDSELTMCEMTTISNLRDADGQGKVLTEVDF